MKRLFGLFAFLILAGIMTGCSDSPSSGMKKDQYALVNDNVKKVLGSDYEAQNFSVVEEGYTNQEKTFYAVKYTFDLNKQYLVFDGKKVPGELIFSKNNGEWECTFNSGNALGFFNMLK